MRTLREDPRLGALPEAWTAASRSIETGPGIDCLTAEAIALFIDTPRGRQTPAALRAARGHAADHLARCSFCTGEVGALFRARQERAARSRARVALGERASRVAACLRVAVERARGAFTHADGLLSGLGRPAQLVPVLPELAFGPLRGEADDSPEAGEGVHEVMVSGEGLPPTTILLSEERGEGGITLLLPQPMEVRLIHPDGRSEALPVTPADEGYCASVDQLPEGEYCLALFTP